MVAHPNEHGVWDRLDTFGEGKGFKLREGLMRVGGGKVRGGMPPEDKRNPVESECADEERYDQRYCGAESWAFVLEEAVSESTEEDGPADVESEKAVPAHVCNR